MEEWKFHPLPKTQGTAFHSVYWEVFFPCKRQDCDKQYFSPDKVFLCKPPASDGAESGAGTWSPDPHIRHNSGDTPAPIPGVLHPHHRPQAAPPEWEPWGGAQDIQEEERQERFPTCLHEGDAVMQYFTIQLLTISINISGHKTWETEPASQPMWPDPWLQFCPLCGEVSSAGGGLPVTLE